MYRLFTTAVTVLTLSLLLASCTSNNEESTRTQSLLTQRSEQFSRVAQESISSLFLTRTTNLSNQAEAFALDLQKNQSFVLAYFLDKSYGAHEITSVAPRFKALSGVDYVVLSDSSGTVLSRSANTPQADTLAYNTFVYDSLTQSIVYQTSHSLSRGQLELTLGTSIDQEDITTYYQNTGVHFILQYHGLPLFSTLNSAQSIGSIDDTHLTINGDTLQVVNGQISNELSYILFIDSIK